MISVTLKEEGNQLFAAKKFAEASDKYSEAIRHDSDNPLLWANRAACALNLKEYKKAIKDSEKTVALDPASTKGWARLATAQQALGNLPASIESWGKAIETLPTNKTVTEQRHYESYQKALDVATKAQEKYVVHRQINEPAILEMHNTGNMPWDVAGPLVQASRRSGKLPTKISSAWIIYEAHETFEEGVSYMSALEKKATPKGNQSYGNKGGIAAFSNGVLMDIRVFRITDPSFIDNYNRQLMFEDTFCHAWQDGTADEVKREAPRRLERQGWDAVRPAISLTARAYLMRGMFISGLGGEYAEAARLQGEAIEILNWGAQKWKNVPYEQKGSVFRPTFIVGAKSMMLEIYLNGFIKNARSHPISDTQYFTLDGLYELASELMKDVIANPPDVNHPAPPGFFLAYYLYPESRARSCFAIYHKYCAKWSTDRSEAVEHYKKAAEHYQEAAKILPEDEELRPWYLHAAFEMMCRGDTPLSVTLPLMEQIRIDTPKMQTLWANSALQREGRDITLKKTIKFESEVREALETGELDLSSYYTPDFFEPHHA